VTTFAKDDVLLKVTRAKKVEIGFFSEGVRLEQESNHTIEDLRHRATADRLKLAGEHVPRRQGPGVLSKCTRCPVRLTRRSGSLTWPTRVASRS
jgi:hypothetical protein